MVVVILLQKYFSVLGEGAWSSRALFFFKTFPTSKSQWQ